MSVSPPSGMPSSFATFGRMDGFAPYLMLIAALLIAYANVFDNQFLYDDDFLIVRNQYLRGWHHLPQIFSTTLMAGSDVYDNYYYRPLQTLLYLVTFQIAGLSTFAFHALNLALHSLNACLMLALGFRLGFYRPAVVAATLVWALHPLHVEAVTYMSATADTLYASLCLLGILALLPDFNRRRVVLSAFCFALALLSKENAIVFPLLAASVFYLKSDRRFDVRAYLRFWPYGLVALGYGIVHVALPLHALPPAATTAASPVAGQSPLMPFATLPLYARLIVWPTQLFMEHSAAIAEPYRLLAIAAGLGMIVLAGMQLFQKEKTANVPLTWGLLWFFAAHLPVFYVDAIVYEHWMYLPTVGLALGVAQTLADKIRPSRDKPLAVYGVPLVVLCVAATLGRLTYDQNRLWSDPATFYRHILDQGYPAPKAHANLGLYYVKNGDYEKALEQFDAAVRESGDTEAAVHNNIAITLENMPDHDRYGGDILRHFQRALAIDPDNYLALTNLAAYDDAHGDAAGAAAYRLRADDVRNRFRTFSGNQPLPPPTKDQP